MENKILEHQPISSNISSNISFQLGSLLSNPIIVSWIDEWYNIFLPKDVVICTGKDDQHRTFCDQMIDEGRMIKLNEQLYQDCYLCRSDPNDVARTENRTFICSIIAFPQFIWTFIFRYTFYIKFYMIKKLNIILFTIIYLYQKKWRSFTMPFYLFFIIFSLNFQTLLIISF